MTNCNMNENFQDILFHYNPYEDLWYAFKRSDANSYFSDRKSVFTLSAKNIKDLIKGISTGIELG
jgi:hypothetical protein